MNALRVRRWQTFLRSPSRRRARSSLVAATTAVTCLSFAVIGPAAPPASATTMVSLSGTVALADSTPVANATVEYTDGATYSMVVAYTDESGHYSMSVSPGFGYFRFVTWHPDHPNDDGNHLFTSHRSTPSLPRMIQVWRIPVDTDSLRNVVLPLVHQVTATALDEAGEPRAGTIISASDEGCWIGLVGGAAEPLYRCSARPASVTNGATDETGTATFTAFDSSSWSSQPPTFSAIAAGSPEYHATSTLWSLTDDVSLPLALAPLPVPTATVSGSVALPDGTPVRGVTLWTRCSDGKYRYTTTDGSGLYTVVLPISGCSIDVRGYDPSAPKDWQLTPSTPSLPLAFSMSRYVDVTQDTTVDIVLPAVRTLTVTVRDGQGAPVPFANVSSPESYGSGASGWIAWAPVGYAGSTTADAAGQFVVLAPDSTSWPVATVGMTASDPTDPALTGRLALSDVHSDAALDLVLHPPAIVTGIVSTQAGTPVARATVTFQPLGGGTPSSATTSEDGTYKLAAERAEGTMRLRTASSSAPPMPDMTLDYTVNATDDVQRNFVVPTPHAVTVAVVDSHGGPVVRAGLNSLNYACSAVGATSCTWRTPAPLATSGWPPPRLSLGSDGRVTFAVPDSSAWTGPLWLGAVDLTNSGRSGEATTSTVLEDTTVTIALPDPPAAPETTEATAPDPTTVDVVWTPPSDDGGSAITDYVVTVEDAAIAAAVRPLGTGRAATQTAIETIVRMLPADARSARFTSLPTGHTYRITVVARNVIGPGVPRSSSVVVGTLATAPGAPTQVAARAGNGSAAVTWSAPSSDGGSTIDRYDVSAVPGGSMCTVTMPAPLTCMVGGLVNGTPYTFLVRAHSSVGMSGPSIPSSAAIPATVPSTVRLMTALAVSNGRTQVTWKAPSSTGGRPVLGYRYCRVGCAVATSWRGVGSSHGVPLRSLLLTSLIKGRTYVVYVRAVNAIGDGPMVKLAFRQKR